MLVGVIPDTHGLFLVRVSSLLLTMTTGCFTTVMPGQSHQGALPSDTVEDRDTAAELRRHVQKLAGDIGERRVGRPDGLHAAASYIGAELAAYGYTVEEQRFEASGVNVSNLSAER